MEQFDKPSKAVDSTENVRSLSEEAISSIIGKIEEHGFLEENLEILAIYNEAKKTFESIGRTKVKIKLRDIGVSENFHGKSRS